MPHAPSGSTNVAPVSRYACASGREGAVAQLIYRDQTLFCVRRSGHTVWTTGVSCDDLEYHAGLRGTMKGTGMPRGTGLLRRVASPLKTWTVRLVDSRIRSTPYISAKVLPLQDENGYSVVLKADIGDSPTAPDGLPLPPKELWAGYGDSPEEYIAGGLADMHTMLDLLAEAGAEPAGWTRVLDFGCAAGRMLRHYPRSGATHESWGVDFNATCITWCQQHFRPPFLFAATTTLPHLPFEDNWFDLVFCGSVFTHISDLADAWLLELRRVIRPGGYVYITLHEKRSIELLRTKYRYSASRLLDWLKPAIGTLVSCPKTTHHFRLQSIHTTWFTRSTISTTWNGSGQT